MPVDLVYEALKLLASLLLRFGWRLRVYGLHHVPRRGGFVLASNHLSFMDPVVLGVACPRRLVFVARADLFTKRWLGPLLRLLRAIPIHSNRVEIGLRDAVRQLRSGQPVAIFPEGGRQFSGTMGIAKPGVGLLAASARAPIVPVLLTGTFEALPPNARMVRLTKIHVAFGPQIRYPEASAADEERRTEAQHTELYEALANQVTATWRQLATGDQWNRRTFKP